MVARDADGTVVAARTRCFSGKVAAEFAEALAIKEAMSWIKEHGWQEVLLESDCLAVVQAIRSKVKIRSSFGLEVEECRREIRLSNILSLLFIKQSANTVAHCFARASYKYPDRSFGSDIPTEFFDCISLDSIFE